jgi:hypothetical protein
VAKFDPKMLVPALPAAADANKRSTKDVVLANINKMKEQLAAGDGAEGKKNFKPVEGNRIEFTIRVSNTPLVLERVKVQDTDVEVSAMTVPTANFVEALDYYADRIKAGEYDAQLATLSEKREARTTKLKATRAEKKAKEEQPN